MGKGKKIQAKEGGEVPEDRLLQGSLSAISCSEDAKISTAVVALLEQWLNKLNMVILSPLLSGQKTSLFNRIKPFFFQLLLCVSL